MISYKFTFALMVCFSLALQGCGSEEQENEDPIVVEEPPVEEPPVEEPPVEEPPVEEPPVEEPPVEEPSDFEIAMAKCNNPWNENGLPITNNNNSQTNNQLSTCYRVSGTVDGLVNDAIELSLNGAESIIQLDQGQFEFLTPLLSDDAFTLRIKAAPTNHQCALINNTGTIGAANVSDVIVHCIATTNQCNKTTAAVTDNKDLSGNNIVGIESLVVDIECGTETWRIDANERINTVRKTSGNISFIDKNGAPVSNVNVNFTLKKHQFGFGGVIKANMWRRTVNGVVDNDFSELYKRTYLGFGFNKAGFANSLKYKLRGSGDLMPEIFTWFKANDIPVRGHALIWPKWASMEANISQADADSMGITAGPPINLPADELKKYVDEIIIRWAQKWDVVEWDVANELRGSHNVQDILGYQEEAHWFKLAKENVQNSATLFLNDNRIISDNINAENITTRMATFKANVESIAADDVLNEGRVEALGFQSRFGTMLSAETIYQRLAYFDDLNLPIAATEFEIKGQIITDELERAILTERVMTAYFSKANVRDIMAWTFFDNGKDRNLVSLDGDVNLRGKTWLYLVKKHWHTDVITWLDNQGQTALNGFKGEYTATVSFDNYPDQEVNFSWLDGSAGTTLQLANYVNGADSTIPANFTIDNFVNVTVAENSIYTSTVPSLSGDERIGDVTWTIAGDDASLFTVEPATGILTLPAQDFEAANDADADNNYVVTLVATDSVGNNAQLAVVISVTDVDEVVAYLPAQISGNNGSIASVIEAGGLTFIRPTLAAETALEGGTITIEGNDWGVFNWAEAGVYCSDIGARLPTKTDLSDNLLPLVNDGSFVGAEHWPVNKNYWTSTSPSAGKHNIMKTTIVPGKMSSLLDSNRLLVSCVR